MTRIKVEDPYGTPTELPYHVKERTEALLSTYPPTNQRIVVDTMHWWLENCGTCPIYYWLVHHLEQLELDGHTHNRDSIELYGDAAEQAEDLGLDLSEDD